MGDRFSASFTFDGQRYYAKGRTQEEANRKAAEKRAQLEAGKINESTVSFDVWFKEYIDVYKSKVSDKTRNDYLQLYKNAIYPAIGKIPLRSIRQIQCQKLLNNLEGKSSSYVHKVFILAKGAFEAAVDNDLLSKSPMRGLKEPDAPSGTRRALTQEERKTFLKAADTCGDVGYYGKIVYFCGLRPSEALRVRAEDFDRLNRRLSVRGSKTKSANRTVPIPKALDFPKKQSGLLFTSHGSMLTKSGQRNWWLKLAKAMEDVSGEPLAEDFTMYCLRHDFGTRCIEAGIDIETVSKMMGHANVAITSKIYLHETPVTLQNALDKMDVMYEE